MPIEPFSLAASIIISIVLSFMTSVMEKQAMSSRHADVTKAPESGVEIKSNTRGTDLPMRIIYGKHRVGANNVYASTVGEHNYNLYYAHTLCEGPIEGIEEDELGNPYIWLDGDLIHTKYEDYYWYDEKTGTSNQTQDTVINTAISEFTDPMHYTAYIAWRVKYNEDLFRGIPEFQYLLKGKLLYDFRDDTTAWSDNPVLALYDLFTNERYDIGISASELDLVSWEEAADYCDSKNFKINMVVNIDEKNVWTVVEEVMNLFRGSFTYWDLKYYLRFRDLNEESSVMTINDEHIYQDESTKAVLSLSDPGYYDIPKGMRVEYINSDNNLYVEDSFYIGEETGVIPDFSLKGCTDRETAGILGTSELERRQLTRTISGRFRDDCLLLEPNDIVMFNSTALNIADQVMRVESAIYSSSGFIDLVLAYENEDIYNDVYDINVENVYNTTLPDPTVPTLIENSAISEETYIQRLRTFSRLNITFDIPVNSWFKHVEVWVSTNGDVEANYKHQFIVTDSFTIDPVEESETYYILLRTVNIWGTKQDLDQSVKLSKYITGKSNTPPDSLTYLDAIPGNGSVSLRSLKLSDPDIEIYEFRVGDQWTGGIFLSAKRSPHEELSLVKPGTHSFWCNTKGTNNLYGTYPQDASVTVVVPKGWSAYTTFTDDYTDDTNGQEFVNTEHLTYSGDDYLKCSHDTAYNDSTDVSSFLNGYYISEEFDTGVTADEYYMYLDTDFVTVGAGTTWADLLVVPASTTWADVNADTRSWKDMFEIEEAPQVTIRIWFKAESGHDWSYLENAQILAGVVTARYFKVEVEITDPSVNINAYVKNYTLRLFS